MTTIFILISTIYLLSLAIVDSLFNRLVFGENRQLPYDSKIKTKIYQKWEWSAVGFIFLIFLPIILPSFIAYLLGGVQLFTTYLIVLFLVPWDLVFSILVFDNLFGDKPSIAIPFLGWFNFSLIGMYSVRLALALILFLLKFKFSI